MRIPKSALNKFKKAERLCDPRAIARLHSKGKAFLVYPLRAIFIEEIEQPKKIEEEEQELSNKPLFCSKAVVYSKTATPLLYAKIADAEKPTGYKIEKRLKIDAKSDNQAGYKIEKRLKIDAKSDNQAGYKIEEPLSEPLKTEIANHRGEYREPLKVLIVTPKRLFKRAVDRNLLRRRIKESYRLNRTPLKETLIQQERAIELQITYIAKEILEYHAIDRAVKEILKKLTHSHSATAD